MKPVEFVLWLNGAAGLVGDQPPTPEQWATMCEKLREAVGGIVAARLLERAEGRAKFYAWGNTEGAATAELMRQHLELLRQKAQMPGILRDVPEPPKPHNPGFLNRILGKAGL